MTIKDGVGIYIHKHTREIIEVTKYKEVYCVYDYSGGVSYYADAKFLNAYTCVTLNAYDTIPRNDLVGKLVKFRTDLKVNNTYGYVPFTEGHVGIKKGKVKSIGWKDSNKYLIITPPKPTKVNTLIISPAMLDTAFINRNYPEKKEEIKKPVYKYDAAYDDYSYYDTYKYDDYYSSAYRGSFPKPPFSSKDLVLSPKDELLEVKYMRDDFVITTNMSVYHKDQLTKATREGEDGK